MPFRTASGTGLSAIAEKLHLGTLKVHVSCCLPIEDKDDTVPSHTHVAFDLYYCALLAMAGNVFERILCCVSSRHLCIYNVSDRLRMRGLRCLR